MKKLILTVFQLLAFFILFASTTFAALVTKTSGNLKITSEEPMFGGSASWLPGQNQTKSITVNNLDTQNHTFAVRAENFSQTGLADVLEINIKQSGINRYGPNSLRQFWDAGELSLSEIPGGSQAIYDFSISLPPETGNPYQGKSASFDLLVGFTGTNDSAQIAGTSTSNSAPPTCSQSAPGTPTLLSAVAGLNSVTLTWVKATGQVTYYLVAYGPSPGNYLYGNPNIGGDQTTSYTVNNLSGNTNYYFVVRAGNGCAPGLFSNELLGFPQGPVVAGIGTGFSPLMEVEQEVLGAATTPIPTPRSTPTVLGSAPLGSGSGFLFLSWSAFLTGVILFLLILLWLIYRRGRHLNQSNF